MRISELLVAIASWLESPENEAVLLSEYDEDCLEATATACAAAAAILKKGAEVVEQLEPAPESSVTPESLDMLASIANAFDNSDDEELKKSASVIDELLLTIAASPDAVNQLKQAQQKKIDILKEKYQKPRDEQRKLDKLSEAEKAIKDSPYMKDVSFGNSLNTRYCPDHPGVPTARVGENEWQCNLDKKVYNYEVGYTNEKNEKIPGGSVAEQNVKDYMEPVSLFYNPSQSE